MIYFILTFKKRYNKDDILPLECRMMLHNEQQRKNSTTKSKLAVYNNIVDQFKPVFRFFFQERFKDPSEWYILRYHHINFQIQLA